jgi:hypothetical protein
MTVPGNMTIKHIKTQGPDLAISHAGEKRNLNVRLNSLQNLRLIIKDFCSRFRKLLNSHICRSIFIHFHIRILEKSSDDDVIVFFDLE